MRRRNLVWNTSSFPWIVNDVSQYQAPYRRTVNASVDFNPGVDTEIGGSPYRSQQGESLFGFTDPGVDLLVTVAGCCHIADKIGEFFNAFKVFSTNHDWVVHSNVHTQNLGLLCVDLETNSVSCFAQTFRSLFGILLFTG